MAPSPPNWLSFSLSPMEMLNSTNSHLVHHYDTPSADTSPHPHYFLDNLFANEWTHPKSEVVLNSTQVEQNHQNKLENHQQQQQQQHSINMDGEPSSIAVTSLNRVNQQQALAVPKLEDFFDNETQDSSSLTQIYFNNDQHQDLNAIAALKAFSNTNSGSEVDDSVSVAKTQGTKPGEFGGGANSVESSGTELAVSCGGSNIKKDTLSLCAVAQDSGKRKTIALAGSDKAIAVADNSDGSKKVVDTIGLRTSVFRGVTRHRWTGRYEAHLWDNSCRREGQARKGRQVYLGGYDKEEKAARAYDLAALKYWGPTATTNFPISNYAKELEEMKHAGKQEFIASIRRKSSGFSRGASIYRGVTRHHQQGRWQARIGRVAGNKDLYLGTFATEEEAAEAYDIAAIKFRGLNAVTNFEMNRYDVQSIMNNSLPVGGTSKRLKLSLDSEEKESPRSIDLQAQNTNVSSCVNFSTIQPSMAPTSTQFDLATAFYHRNHFPRFHPTNAFNGSAKSFPQVTAANSTAPSALPAVPGFGIWPRQSY